MSQSQNEKKDSISRLVGASPTAEIAEAQKSRVDSEEQGHPVMYLFFSFDIVNSTSYKTTTSYWPIVMESLLSEIQSKVKSLVSNESLLWRVIGDEMIFFKEVNKKEDLNTYVKSIFSLTQDMSLRLRSGKFFERIESQKLKKGDIQQLSSQSPLSMKATAWVAAVNKQYDQPYDCIEINYCTSALENSILDFLGSDVDAGFRLKQYTQDRRVALSFELAYLLLKFNQCEDSNLHIIDYVRLKGVWNETLYPVIWYHNESVIESLNNSSSIVPVTFEESFRYDELLQNPISNNFLSRIKQIEKTEGEVCHSYDIPLSNRMFKVIEAFDKILVDKNLKDKIDYLESLITPTFRANAPFEQPLELHCAVVCCDIDEGKVMIVHRGSSQSGDAGKWEFGCAKAKSSVTLVKTIEEYYKEIYAVEIKLCLDENRDERQPKPFAVYEVKEAPNKLKKGIIFAAKVIKKYNHRGNTLHDEVRWVTKEDLSEPEYQNSIKDFQKTLETIFNVEAIWGKKNGK